MVRTATSILFLVVVGCASLISTAPSARASTIVSGTLGADEILPRESAVYRRSKAARQRGYEAYRRAERRGDRHAMSLLASELRRLEQDMRQLARLLQQARTTVYVYGDAAEDMGRADIIAMLRADQTWRYRAVHIFQRRGVLYWDLRAPRGYDDRRGSAAQPTVKPNTSAAHGNRRRPSRPTSRPMLGGGVSGGELFGLGGLGR